MKRDVPAYQRCSFQDWTQRTVEVIAARSEFSLASVRSMPRSMTTPIAAFRLAAGAVVRLRLPDTPLRCATADRALVPIVGLGGLESVRGYRQDL